MSEWMAADSERSGHGSRGISKAVAGDWCRYHIGGHGESSDDDLACEKRMVEGFKGKGYGECTEYGGGVEGVKGSLDTAAS